MTEIAILALFAVSLDLVLGYGGIVSLGHAAFFGTGCYVAGLFAEHVLPDPLVGLAAATAAAAVLVRSHERAGAARQSDLTRLMVTLAVALILYELANRFDAITGGADGLQGIVMGRSSAASPSIWAAASAMRTACAVLFVLFVVARRLIHAPFGYSLRAIRGNRLRAAAVGIPVGARLAAIYTLGAAYAGAAGALLAQTTGFASLDVFDFHRSADVLLVLVIGGAGYLYGGIVGAVAFTVMHDTLSALTPQYWLFWLGLMLVLLVLVGHERLVRRWRALRRAVAAPRFRVIHRRHGEHAP